jgi:hypothetical protein
MTDLKLIALDAEDLDVISATTQDAIVRTAEMGYARADKRFALLMNRFAWEQDGKGAPKSAPKTGTRKRAALHFDHVTAVKAAGFDPAAPEGTLELLTIRFTEADSPSGHVDLAFAGGGTVRLEVEVLEARLADLGAAWAASKKPEHTL